MAKKQVLQVLEDEDLDRVVERAGMLAAREVTRQTREDMRRLTRYLQLTHKLVTRDDLAFWLGVSTKTVKNWGIPHDNRVGNTTFYWLPDVIEYLRAAGGEPADTAEKAIQKSALMSSSSDSS